MYGYVRPLKGELKVSQFETFQSVYCGLCGTLRRRYGPIFRFLVNYDFTFLAMLLAGPDAPDCVYRHCPASIFRKRRCLCPRPELDAAADYSVILAYWKLKDGARDSRFFPALGYRMAGGLLKGKYKKAAKKSPGFADAAGQHLEELNALESVRCESLDRMADKFALILRGAADGEQDETRRRILSELLYHLGRVIYILDAVDDLAQDVKSGAYNPLIYRFSSRDGVLSEQDCQSLRSTIGLSQSNIASAFALLEPNPYAQILENTIYLGLPGMTETIFTMDKKTRKKIKRQKTGDIDD